MNFRTNIFFLTLIIFIFSQANSQPIWDKLPGPEGAFVNCSTLRSSDGAIFIGTNAGKVYRSYDGGANWENITNNLPSERVGAILEHNNAVYLSMYEHGIFKTVDDGNSWVEKNTGIDLTFKNFRCLAKNNLGYLYTGGYYSTGKIYTSTDAGENWTSIDGDQIGSTVNELAINNLGHIFAGTQGDGIYFTNDNGTNWQQRNAGLNYQTIRSLFIKTDGTIYAGTLYSGLNKSTDNGVNWIDESANLSSYTINCIDITNDDQIIVGTGISASGTANHGFFKWNPNSLSWDLKGMENSDVYTLETNGNIVFAGTWIGMNKSDDNGDNWYPVVHGLNSINASHIKINSNNQYIVGTYEGIARSDDGGDTWSWKNNGMSDLYIRSMYIHNDDKLYCGTLEGFIYLSEDNGENWMEIGALGTWINALVVNDAGHVFAATHGWDIHRTTDGGATWNNISDGIFSGAYALEKNDSGHIFAGSDYSEGIFRSVDNGDSWTDITNNLAGQTVTVYSILINNENHIFLGTAASYIYRSTNNGDSWTQVNSGVTDNYIFSLAMSDNGDIFAGGDNYGIFRTTNNGVGWANINEGFEFARVSDLSLSSDQYLIAGTQDGVVSTNIPVVLSPAIPELPSNNATDISVPVTLQWENMEGAWSYRIQLDDENTFITPVFVNNDVNTNTQVVTGLSAFTQYFWRVRAVNYFNIGEWSDTWSFTTSQVPPPAPGLVSPQNQAENLPVDPTLTWNAVNSAESYHLQVADNDMFNSPVFDDATLSATSQQISGLSKITQYFWRVRAANSAGPGDWSDTWSFTTIPDIPLAPDLISPSNFSVNVPFNPTLSWNAVDYAKTYELQVAKEISIGSPVFSKSDIIETSFQLSSLDFFQDYFWRIRASNAAGDGDWSAIWKFKTSTGLNSPQLEQPDDGQTDIAVNARLSWSEVIGANNYLVRIGDNQLFSNILEEETGITDNYYDPKNLNYDQTYFWLVIAYSNGGAFGISEIRKFTTRSYPASFPVSAEFVFPDLDNPKDFQPQDYKIVGIPGDSEMPLQNIMQGEHGVNWQAYWDNGDAENYFSEFDGSSIFELDEGRAFWIISQGQLSVNTTVPSPELTPGLEAEIEVHNGWNLITCPFPVSMSWPAVQEVNSISSPIFRFTNNGNFVEADIMIPYIGYYFFNGAGLTDLRIPVKASIMKPAVIPEKSWEMSVTMVTTDELESSVTIGLSPDAENGLDNMDYRKPRALGELPSVYFNRSEWDTDYPDFATDIRKKINDIETWDLTVQHAAYQNVTLYFDQLDYLSEGMEIYLIDRTNLRSVDLNEQNRYEFASPKTKSSFEIIIGTEELIGKRINELIPQEYIIGENFPNPFNPSTTIPVMIPVESYITLSVYDLLGKKIKTIADDSYTPGQYYFRWDGSDNLNHQVAAGIYFYQVIINQSDKHLGKMILIK